MFGQIIRSHREAHGLSQAQVADALGISRNYVSLLERGVKDNVSFKLACRILSLAGSHIQVPVILSRRVEVDLQIATEIVWLNQQGVLTEGCCVGPPPTAMILPSSMCRAEELGYLPVYEVITGLFSIVLKSRVGL